MEIKKFIESVLVIDLKTNGVNPDSSEVIQTGLGFKVDGEWLVCSEFHDCSDNIGASTSAQTHITKELVAGEKPFSDAIDTLNAIIDEKVGDIGVCVAHYDLPTASLLTRHGTNATRWISTSRLAKKLFADDPTVTDFSLQYLRYHFGIVVPGDLVPGRADMDATIISNLLEVLVGVMVERGIIDTSSNVGEQILDWLSGPIVYDTVKFGKYAGTKMVDVPLSYWSWAVAKMDLLNPESSAYDLDFAASVEVALEEIANKSHS